MLKCPRCGGHMSVQRAIVFSDRLLRIRACNWCSNANEAVVTSEVIEHSITTAINPKHIIKVHPKRSVLPTHITKVDGTFQFLMPDGTCR
jgi:hypothetical protein